MSHLAMTTPIPPDKDTRWRQMLSLDNRFMPPLLITLILLVGNVSFGILESYQKTLLAIVTSMVAELSWAVSSFINGLILPAPTSPASALVFFCVLHFFGHTHCVACLPSLQSMFCA